jgi:hypothetical protein
MCDDIPTPHIVSPTKATQIHRIPCPLTYLRDFETVFPREMSESSAASKFANALYMIAMEPRNCQAIGFSDNGLCLELRNEAALAATLPKYFKTEKLESFKRQLNNYGFEASCTFVNLIVTKIFGSLGLLRPSINSGLV